MPFKDVPSTVFTDPRTFMRASTFGKRTLYQRKLPSVALLNTKDLILLIAFKVTDPCQALPPPSRVFCFAPTLSGPTLCSPLYAARVGRRFSGSVPFHVLISVSSVYFFSSQETFFFFPKFSTLIPPIQIRKGGVALPSFLAFCPLVEYFLPFFIPSCCSLCDMLPHPCGNSVYLFSNPFCGAPTLHHISFIHKELSLPRW